MNGWSEIEEDKIKQLMNTEILHDNGKVIKPSRMEAIRMMRRLQEAGKWKPEDHRVQAV